LSYTAEPVSRCRSATGLLKTSIFSTSGFDPSRLQSRLPFFRDLDRDDPDAWVHFKTDSLEALIDRDGPVKVSFLGGLNELQRVQNPLRAAGSRVLVASLVDLAGMKMRVIMAMEH
jgi:hypothetical protein